MPIETIFDINLPYYLVAFDKYGNERSDDPHNKMSQQVLNVLATQPITDVFLFSHGWMGDIDAARSQYSRWVKEMAGQTSDIAKIQQARSGFRPLIIGLHWPSLPWGNEELTSSSISSFPIDSAPEEQLVEQYSERIANTPAAKQALQRIFAEAKENIAPFSLPPQVLEAYQILDQEACLGNDGVGAAPGSDREPFDPEAIFDTAVDEEPFSYGSFSFGGILSPLRVLSFWKMKDRSRRFGENGGFKLLQDLQSACEHNVRFHLMGHSFGCIVVSAMLSGLNGQGILARPVNSVALIQGALSLWSYCSSIPYAPERTGYFHSIIAERKVMGPIITTQSEFDTAIRRFYPWGAGLRNQMEYSPKLPKYGALGEFGARGSGLEVVDLKMLPVSASYQFEPGKIYNLESSQFICGVEGVEGAHNEIAKPEVAHAIWNAASM